MDKLNKWINWNVVIFSRDELSPTDQPSRSQNIPKLLWSDHNLSEFTLSKVNRFLEILYVPILTFFRKFYWSNSIKSHLDSGSCAVETERQKSVVKIPLSQSLMFVGGAGQEKRRLRVRDWSMSQWVSQLIKSIDTSIKEQIKWSFYQSNNFNYQRSNRALNQQGIHKVRSIYQKQN